MAWSPPNFQNSAERLVEDPRGFGHDLDQSIQIIYKQEASLQTILDGIVNGTSTVSGALTRISTGLSTVTNAIASLDSAAAINEIVTVSLGQSGLISLYVWKPTAAGNTTPIASTTARTVRWVAFGTK